VVNIQVEDNVQMLSNFRGEQWVAHAVSPALSMRSTLSMAVAFQGKEAPSESLPAHGARAIR
jgi:hypothetical protein